jgi:hypothetical protein
MKAAFVHHISVWLLFGVVSRAFCHFLLNSPVLSLLSLWAVPCVTGAAFERLPILLVLPKKKKKRTSSKKRGWEGGGDERAKDIRDPKLSGI